MKKKYSNQGGMNLLELLVAVGIISIVSLGLATLIVNSMKGTQGVEAKLAILELQKSLTSVSPGINICAFAISQNPDAYTKPTSNFFTQSYSLERISLSTDGTQILARLDSKLQGSNSLTVSGISLKNLLSSGGNIIADLTIDFSGPGFFKSISTKVILSTTVTGTNTQLTGCNTVLNSPGSGNSLQCTTKRINLNSTVDKISCDSDEIATGGGCGAANNQKLATSGPIGTTNSAWRCTCRDTAGTTLQYCPELYVICCK